MLWTKAAILQQSNMINSAVTVPRHILWDTSVPAGSLEGLLSLWPGWRRLGFAASRGRDTWEGCSGCSGITSGRIAHNSQRLSEVSWTWPWRLGPTRLLAAGAKLRHIAWVQTLAALTARCLRTTPVGHGARLLPHPLPRAWQRSWALQPPLAQALFLC